MAAPASCVPRLYPQGKQHYLLYCLTPAMKPRMLMTGALCWPVLYWLECLPLGATGCWLPPLLQVLLLACTPMCCCHAAHMHAHLTCCRAGMPPSFGRVLDLICNRLCRPPWGRAPAPLAGLGAARGCGWGAATC